MTDTFTVKWRNGAKTPRRIGREHWLALFRNNAATVHNGKPAVLRARENDGRRVWEFVHITEGKPRNARHCR